MGSQATQGKLWGRHVTDWAELLEPTGKAGYDLTLKTISASNGPKLLDVGCGTGYFSKMALDHGFDVTGTDATLEFIEAAKKRAPGANFSVGEMEELPFADNSFDVVCGFNSFQYAADTKNALSQAKRVLKPGGKLVAMIWGDKEDCESAVSFKAIGELAPIPPPGAPGPFAMSENHLLENILKELGLKILETTDVPSVWDYPNEDMLVRGFLSTGPAAKAIDHSGFERVKAVLLASALQFTQSNGHVIYRNKFRVVIAEK